MGLRVNIDCLLYRFDVVEVKEKEKADTLAKEFLSSGISQGGSCLKIMEKAAEFGGLG